MVHSAAGDLSHGNRIPFPEVSKRHSTSWLLCMSKCELKSRTQGFPHLPLLVVFPHPWMSQDGGDEVEMPQWTQQDGGDGMEVSRWTHQDGDDGIEVPR